MRFEEASTRFKNASPYNIELLLTEMEWKGSFHDVFECYLDRWKLSSSFMNAFLQRTLNSPCFVWPVAKCDCENVKDRVVETEKRREWKSIFRRCRNPRRLRQNHRKMTNTASMQNTNVLKQKKHWENARNIENSKRRITRHFHFHPKARWVPPVCPTRAETLYC